MVFLAAVTLAFTTGCSFSLATKTPEVLRYCRLSERTDTTEPGDSPGENSQVTSSTANGLPSDCDDASCGSDASGEEASARRTVCAP
jgi:hypothetical protein